MNHRFTMQAKITPGSMGRKRAPLPAAVVPLKEILREDAMTVPSGAAFLDCIGRRESSLVPCTANDRSAIQCCSPFVDPLHWDTGVA
jgi:hypothetical protein